MRIYECENCYSVFIINEAHPKIQNGDYAPLKANLDCPLCSCDMILINKEKEDTKV